MRIGIIAEGKGDLAVLQNVLIGALGIDSEEVQFLRPEHYLDETDLAAAEAFSNWELVIKECRDRTCIDEFLNAPVDEERLLILHIDTAEADLPHYGVKRPTKKSNATYAADLRSVVIQMLSAFLDVDTIGFIRFAIAVEETDAWVLTLFDFDFSERHHDPKRVLLEAINRTLSKKQRQKLFQLSTFDRYAQLTKEFRRKKDLSRRALCNGSLAEFVTSLEGDGNTER